MKATTFITAALLGASATGFAQFKGDDDGILMQKAASRDSIAIAEAVDGWWTASMKNHDARIAWWREAKFGCFIHWGVYSVPGGEWKGKKVGGYAEHLMRKEKIPREEYARQLIQTFNPVDFNADEWVRLIKDAGMKYLIITAKHHDGVAMYPSAIGNYTIGQSAFKRDPMQELSAACKKYGIRFGFYYSHAFDWEHPDAPGNDWDYQNPGGDKNLYGGTNWYDHHPELLPKAVKYVDEKSIPQIKELLLKYHPDIIWFDTPHKLPLSENIRILKAIRETDQNVVVNGRLARSSAVSFGDYKNTADRPAEFYPVEGDWEAIPTTNESYGYSRYDNSHKPAPFFIRLIAKATARGGNLLMNIGPMGNGVIDPRDTVILHSVGQWLKTNGPSVYGATASPLPLQYWGEVTKKGNKLYLHVFNWPANGKLVLGGMQGKIKGASLLASGQTLRFKNNNSDWTFNVPAKAPDTVNTVIVLETKGEIKGDEARLLGSKEKNILRAFDAKLHGKGLGYGDGKAGKDYVQNWKNQDQWLSWKIRLNEPAVLQVSLKYVNENTVKGNTFVLTAGNRKIEGNIGENETYGTFELPAGTYDLELKPGNIKGELMKLQEVILKGK
ncbi:alpha-L-fucosidase [Chitinophaga sp. GCM10012297]|uniref:alpha-L-fucosidase n=1 Tax=Chitinophaga chungangae TaxID=2821488 RepID=A0ABS3YJN7_9BACT|nr:alpha-L-fucosidase [Chitinophaga chungangae]MBO9154867.1 alpha-L-fucosidase [Chitinophaga chungangae]